MGGGGSALRPSRPHFPAIFIPSSSPVGHGLRRQWFADSGRGASFGGGIKNERLQLL